MPLPDTIANAPELGPGLDFFYMAFLDLTSCRELGHAVGPISWLTIQRYAEVYEVEGEQREDLFYYVQGMDDAYLKRAAAKAKKDNKASQKGGRRSRRR